MSEAKGFMKAGGQGAEERNGSRNSDLPRVLTPGANVQGHGVPSSSVAQSGSSNPTGAIPDLENQLAEMSLAKSKSDEGTRDAITKYNDLLKEYNNLQALHKAADTAARTASRQVRDLSNELEETKQQRTEESKTRVALAKDNHLLRSQISEMSIAQEPLREEQYYVLEFTQLRMDIESWAAKETRNMPKQMLSDHECSQIMQILRDCGETGGNTADWFQRIHRGTWQDRRSKIGLIRHFVAVVLFDHVFERFAFGFDRVWSKYFTDMEKLICRNGSYPLAKILLIRQAIGQSVVNLQANSVASVRVSVINTLIPLLQALLAATPQQRIQAFAVKVVDKSVSLKRAMTEEQAIYRCHFFESGDDFEATWMEIDSSDNPSHKVSMCTFPCLRRFTTDMVQRQWIPIVKATVKMTR